MKSCLDGSVDASRRGELLKVATTTQSGLARAAAAGEGIDRHLMMLAKIAREMNADDRAHVGMFDDPLFARSTTWTLSTSNVAAPWLSRFGFGAVAEDGYGLGYQVCNDAIPIHVTCWKASDVSLSSAEMHGAISEALDEMKVVASATGSVTQ